MLLWQIAIFHRIFALQRIVCLLEIVVLMKYKNVDDKITLNVGAFSHFNHFIDCAKRV